MTSKLQVTVPKALAAQYELEPGAEVEWEAGGDAIRLVPAGRRRGDPATRLKLFDRATARQRSRQAGAELAPEPERGWTREDLYDRGRAR